MGLTLNPSPSRSPLCHLNLPVLLLFVLAILEQGRDLAAPSTHSSKYFPLLLHRGLFPASSSTISMILMVFQLLPLVLFQVFQALHGFLRLYSLLLCPLVVFLVGLTLLM